jgi:general secretion pathway protein D
VRLTTDPSSSQVIVLAPPTIHAAIAAELGDRFAPHVPLAADRPVRAGLPAAVPARTSQAAGATQQFLPLTRSPLARVEQQLRQLLGSRLEPRGGSGGAPASGLFFTKGPRRAELTLDASRNGIAVTGDQPLIAQLSQLIQALDRVENQPPAPGQSVRIIPLHQADLATIQQAVDAYRWGTEPSEPDAGDHRSAAPPPQHTGQPGRLRLPVAFAQHTELAAAEPPFFQEDIEPLPPDSLEVLPADEAIAERIRRLMADRVEIEVLPDLDVIILRGRDADVEEVARIIAEIERLAALTVPVIDIYQLRHVHNMSIVTILDLVAQDLIGGRQGRIHVTPLVKPNALLLIGWGEAVTAMKELIAKLDQPVSAESQLRVYQLRHAAVLNVAGLLEDVCRPQGLGPRVEIVPDERTNSLIIRAAPRDLAEVDLLINRMDRGTSGYVSQARLFRLRNTLATELAITLQNAFTAAAGPPGERRSAVLELLTADVKGRRLLRSGVLADAQITPDPHTNSLVVTAPAESMDLLAALIEQLDCPPLSPRSRSSRSSTATRPV